MSECRSTHLLQMVSRGQPQFRSTKSEDVSFSRSLAILLMCSGCPPATCRAVRGVSIGIMLRFTAFKELCSTVCLDGTTIAN
jgi:hypothetical protein